MIDATGRSKGESPNKEATAMTQPHHDKAALVKERTLMLQVRMVVATARK